MILTSFLDGIKSFTNRLINSRSAINNNAVVSHYLPPEQIREIMKTGLANRIVSLKADFATKNGFNFDDEASQEFYTGISREIKKAIFSMIGYGRGVAVLIEPTLPLSEPLRIPKNARVKAFTGDMVTATAAEFDVSNPNYMKPISYIIRDKDVHPSRLIDFTYKEVSEHDAPQYHYGGVGEIELIHDQLINDGIVERSSAGILEKSSILYYKIPGFKQALITEQEDEIIKYVHNAEDLRSVHGAGIMDAEDDVAVISQALTNLAETDQIVLRRVALVTGIPFSVLIGESTGGLNATSETEKDIFNEVIDSIQENYILPPLARLMKIMGYTKPTILVGQNVSDKERLAIDALAIDNAMKLEGMGEDGNLYLSDRGVILESDSSDEDP